MTPSPGFLPFVLLSGRDAFWRDMASARLPWRGLLEMAAFVACACSLYGVVLAGWRSPLLSLYVAAKLPLLFLGTTLLVAGFNWTIASILGSGLSFKSTLFAVFAAMAVGAWMLLALLPVVLFFLLSGVARAGTHAELQYAHNSILVAHVLVLSLAGVAGNAALLGGLRRLVRPRCPAAALFCGWLAAFAFVGCQLSWILRPFVGSPFFPVEFIRPDALDRNFYEFVFTEVLPFLLTGGK